MGSGRDRPRKPGRRTPFRTPKRKILVVCEGANTEPQYFRQFANVHRDAIVDVEIAPGVGVPLTVVREAKRRRDEAARASKREGDPFLSYDAVWCVYDMDEHPHVPEAIQTAARSGIEVALSNPCFELWLLLHLQDAPGMLHRDQAQSSLKELVPGYDKRVDFEVYRQGYPQAVARARRLDELAESVGEPRRNPTTGVYRLTEEIAPTPGGPAVPSAL